MMTLFWYCTGFLNGATLIWILADYFFYQPQRKLVKEIMAAWEKSIQLNFDILQENLRLKSELPVKSPIQPTV